MTYLAPMGILKPDKSETQSFIEDAIAGGWNYKSNPVETIYQILLDPLAWQAVGKTRGWPSRESGTFEAFMGSWEAASEDFFAKVMSGKTIEEALQAIT